MARANTGAYINGAFKGDSGIPLRYLSPKRQQPRLSDESSQGFPSSASGTQRVSSQFSTLSVANISSSGMQPVSSQSSTLSVANRSSSSVANRSSSLSNANRLSALSVDNRSSSGSSSGSSNSAEETLNVIINSTSSEGSTGYYTAPSEVPPTAALPIFPWLITPMRPGGDYTINPFREPASTARYNEQRTQPVPPPPDQRGEDDHRATKRLPVRCMKKCCFLLFVIGVVAGLGILLTMGVLGGDLFFAKASIEMRVKEPFEDALGNRSSPRAKQYRTRVCQQVVASLKNSSQVQRVQDCTVGDISNGSIRFPVTLQFSLKNNLTWSQLEEEVIAMGTRIQRDGSLFLLLGDLLAYFADFRLTDYSVFREASEATTTPAPTTTPPPRGEFDCSLPGSSHYKPYPDTFPFKCAMYQRCQNGIGHHYNCSHGLEFGYIPDTDYGPCHLPSSATYCGKKRAELTTEDTTTSSTTAMTSPTANVTSPKTPVTTTQPSATTDSCLSLEEVYRHNPEELFSCGHTDEQGFRASRETFPNNCDTFVWCTNGAFLNTTVCASGSHFVFGQNGTLQSCRNKGDPDTFCEKMKLAQNCP